MHKGVLALLRDVMADLIANRSPPWATYQGLMKRLLMALDKQPGTHPVGIGSIWLQCCSKMLISEAK